MKTKTDRLGLVSVSFRHRTPKEIVKAASLTGLSCIEWGSDVHASCNDKARLQEICELQKEYGLHCSSYGTYFRFFESPLEDLKRYIQAANILETDILRIWCGRRAGASMTSEERDELLSLCFKATELARSSGVKLCLECHKNTFTEDPDDAVWLMQTVNSPYFRMYWQPFQWQSAERNLENAKKIAPYTEHIHVFNWKGEKKLPLAEAAVEWQGYLSAFSTPRTLLLEFMPNGTPEELPIEAAALKMIIGESV